VEIINNPKIYMTDYEKLKENFQDLKAKTKLEPAWNGYLYLFVFLVGFFADIFIHFFAKRKYNGSFGFGESLMPYYNSMRHWGPEWIDLPGFKSFLYGAIMGGVACMIALMGADIILTWINKDSENK
jgi:hypothetical protein